MATTIAYLLLSILVSANGQNDIFSAVDAQQFATRINCQAEETQHFLYSSVTKLWGSVGGDVAVTADIVLHCLGDGKGGNYEADGLKYLAEVTNLIIEQKNVSHEEAPLRRQKRGVGDFFSDAWTKIKNFFTRMFGGSSDPAVPAGDAVSRDGRKDEEEEEKDIPESTAEELRPLYTVPFQFVQLANGSVPEIRFAENEVDDGRIRNFKRHLVDAFATYLNVDQRKNEIVETTVTGEHTSSYNIEVSGEPVTMNLAGFGVHQQQEEPTVIINKVVTGDKIHKLSPTDAMNDRERLHLKLQQRQVFSGGKLVSSSGTSSVILLPETPRKGRQKRENEDDLTSNFHAHSSYNIQLLKRQRRSAEEATRMELHENLTFLPASRLAEKEDSSDRQRLRKLQKSFGNMTRMFQDMLENQDADYDEKLLIMSEMLQREIELKLDNESQSASKVVRNTLTKEKLHLMCSNNFTVCKDFLQLLAIAGGPKAEEVFLSFLKDDRTFTPLQTRIIASAITDFSKPSSDFLDALVTVVSDKHRNPDVIGSIGLSCGSLGSKADRSTKNKVSATLIKLMKENGDSCEHPHFLLDILEAVGNLNCRKSVPFVLEVSRNCPQSSTIQIACAHALRHHTDLPSVVLWIQNMTSHRDCEVVRAVVGALMDKIQDQQMVGDVSNWPRNGFNQVDENLKRLLSNSRCSVEDIIFYFRKKRNEESNKIANKYYAPEAEPWNAASQSRQKRALWDNLKCNEWTEDNKYRPIQGKEEFDTDREIFNKRKSCLASRRLGIKGANAEIYAGLFAGVKEPSEPLKYKLFTKFVSSLNFLGHQMEIGSFYFYHNSGSTKAYVRIFGQTRQELTHEGCTPMDLKYRPVRHFPLYEVTVYVVQLSLGIHLSGQLGLDTACPSDNQYTTEPKSLVRIGGEAVGSIAVGVGLSSELVQNYETYLATLTHSLGEVNKFGHNYTANIEKFARASFNVGGNLNYKLQFTFTPSPNMCIKGSHGYDPMSISFETYYQLWNVISEDWGRARFWRPNFLSWDITRGELQSWFDDTCIRTEDTSSSINFGRELE